MVRILVQKGVQLQPSLERGSWAAKYFHKAAEEGCTVLINEIIDCGIDVNVVSTDNIRKSPLCVAAVKGRVRIINTLLDCGAKLEAQTRNQDTPLLLAVQSDHVEVVIVLLEHGANIDARNI